MQFDIQHWKQASVKCDVPAALTPSTLSNLVKTNRESEMWDWNC